MTTIGWIKKKIVYNTVDGVDYCHKDCQFHDPDSMGEVAGAFYCLSCEQWSTGPRIDKCINDENNVEYLNK